MLIILMENSFAQHWHLRLLFGSSSEVALAGLIAASHVTICWAIRVMRKLDVALLSMSGERGVRLSSVGLLG